MTHAQSLHGIIINIIDIVTLSATSLLQHINLLTHIATTMLSSISSVASWTSANIIAYCVCAHCFIHAVSLTFSTFIYIRIIVLF